MKFWRVYGNYDPAMTDTLFPTKNAALAYKRELEESEQGYTAELSEWKFEKLNKETVCEIYRRAMR